MLAASSTAMPRHKRKNVVQLIKSGNVLSDWFFAQFTKVLTSERVLIARKKRLVNPDDPHRRVIRGLMDPEIHPSGNWVQILINSAKNTHRCRDEEVETLIHELAHVILPRTSERHILGIENLLVRQFTPGQRRYLKSFLPRHEVKKYPKPYIPGSIGTA